MTAVQTSLADWLPIIRGEFQEIPGLHLSKPQVQCRWGLDASSCDALLDALVDRGFLRRTPTGQYALADAMAGHASRSRQPDDLTRDDAGTSWMTYEIAG